MEQFHTNIVVCDLLSANKFTAEQQAKQISKLDLFDTKCIIFEINSIKLIPKQVPYEEGVNSSKILFCATTSGTCGDKKPISIPYKCFLPNIFEFGWENINLKKKHNRLKFFLQFTENFMTCKKKMLFLYHHPKHSIHLWLIFTCLCISALLYWWWPMT